MTYRDEDDDQLINEALFVGGVCAALILGIAALLKWLLTRYFS